MPIYEYVCEGCAYEFNDIVKVDERMQATTKACPGCKKKKVVLKVSMSNLGDPVALGIVKPSSSFKELMKHHAKKNPKGGLKDKI